MPKTSLQIWGLCTSREKDTEFLRQQWYSVDEVKREVDKAIQRHIENKW